MIALVGAFSLLILFFGACCGVTTAAAYMD